MGERGPARTPTRVLQMRGTYRADRHGDPAQEPAFAPLKALPPAPGFFDDMARATWERVGPELVGQELLTEADLDAFGLYCLNVARVVACEKVINEEGMTLRTPQGFEQARPEVAIARQCGAEARKFAQEFGLTPSARTRVKAPEKKAPKVEDPWGEVANG